MPEPIPHQPMPMARMATRLPFDPDALSALCRHHHIRRLSLFGSVLKGQDRPDSDVDLLFEFERDKEPGLIGLAGTEIELSRLLGGPAKACLSLTSPGYNVPAAQQKKLVSPRLT